jgi:hypothetical protein
MGTVSLVGENECPEGTPIGSWQPVWLQWAFAGSNLLRREVEDFEIVDKECVKPGFSDTLLIRATVRLSRCAGWLGLLCCGERLLAFSMPEGEGCARSRDGAVVYLSKQDLAVLMVSSDLRSAGPMGRSV